MTLHLGASNIGHNRVLVTVSHRSPTAAVPVSTQWFIYSLTGEVEYYAVQIEPIDGPSNPSGVFDTQLVRVGDSVVAFGTLALDDAREQAVHHWFMHVYCIATGEWREIPYVAGESPTHRGFPHLFAVDDTVVLTGGGIEDIDCDTWEWSICTERWTK
ncbi:hypothetical protein KIPB_011829, partial [Kipferlia bialata]|eukprot:g11829.t1